MVRPLPPSPPSRALRPPPVALAGRALLFFGGPGAVALTDATPPPPRARLLLPVSSAFAPRDASFRAVPFRGGRQVQHPTGGA